MRLLTKLALTDILGALQIVMQMLVATRSEKHADSAHDGPDVLSL